MTAPEPPATTEAQLPPLDYDDTSQRRGLALESTLESTRPGKRYRMQHFRWFALGVAFGALVAALWHGGASATCKAMRGWTACAIRSLEHRPTTTVAAVYPQPPATQPPAPCPANGSDLCRELLAPFDAAEVETVNVDDLPRTAPALDPTAATRATPSP